MMVVVVIVVLSYEKKQFSNFCHLKKTPHPVNDNKKEEPFVIIKRAIAFFLRSLDTKVHFRTSSIEPFVWIRIKYCVTQCSKDGKIVQ